PEEVEALRARLAELPDAKLQRFEREYRLPRYETVLLTETVARADYYEQTVAPARGGDDARFATFARQAANWIIGDFARLLNATELDLTDAIAKVPPAHLCAIIELVHDGTL